MAWKITNNNGNLYPPEVQVDTALITMDSAAIDAALTESCRVVGTLIYAPDYSIIKNRNFDGSWVEVEA